MLKWTVVFLKAFIPMCYLNLSNTTAKVKVINNVFSRLNTKKTWNSSENWEWILLIYHWCHTCKTYQHRSTYTKASLWLYDCIWEGFKLFFLLAGARTKFCFIFYPLRKQFLWIVMQYSRLYLLSKTRLTCQYERSLSFHLGPPPFHFSTRFLSHFHQKLHTWRLPGRVLSLSGLQCSDTLPAFSLILWE